MELSEFLRARYAERGVKLRRRDIDDPDVREAWADLGANEAILGMLERARRRGEVGQVETLERVVALLAQVFADHPQFNPHWLP
jgi:hypothetical protein